MEYKKFILCRCVVAVVFCVSANSLIAQDTGMVAAQDTTTVKNKWHFLLEPYVMFPNMHGTVGLGSLPNVSVDENPGDVFKNLQFGAMLYAEANKGFWTISSDFTYMKLKSDVDIKNGIVSGTAEVKQLAWELAGMRQLAPWFELGLAFQLNNIKSDVNLV